MSTRASVVFPDPDSPTMAITSRLRTARSTPSRACATWPVRVVKSTPTRLASSKGAWEDDGSEGKGSLTAPPPGCTRPAVPSPNSRSAGSAS